MTTEEFSREFDILYNNIMSNQAPGLNEFEKSVFLTQAQESLVIDIYKGKYTGESFETTEEVTQYIESLVTKQTLEKILQVGSKKISSVYSKPSDCMFIVNEQATLDSEACSLEDVNIVPVSNDELNKRLRNPFRGPTNSRILRVVYSGNLELVSILPIKEYVIKYLRYPKPIILTDLDSFESELGLESSNLYIGDGNHKFIKKQECELNSVIHRAILGRAVLLAKASWGANN